MTGTVTHFLRTGGCGLRCTWCDSMYAVDPAQIRQNRVMMTVGEIITALTSRTWAPYVTFTGGDPCLQKHLGDVVIALNTHGMRVAVETQGELFPDWLDTCDVVTFSPKGPSSGNVVDIDPLIEWVENQGTRRNKRVCLKVVIERGNSDDFQYAMRLYRAIRPVFYDAFYFTACTPIPVEGDKILPIERVLGVLEAQQWVAKQVLDCAGTMNEKVHVGCQQHVLLWPDKQQGV